MFKEPRDKENWNFPIRNNKKEKKGENFQIEKMVLAGILFKDSFTPTMSNLHKTRLVYY